MTVYTSMSHSHTSQHWTHLPRCEFIQLAVIRSEELQRGDREGEMIRLAQQGKIETILDDKEPIDLCKLSLTGKSLSYNFLHLSVQELLAAYYISKPDSSKQVEVFKHMLGGSRFQAVLHYYSGFTKLANPAVRDLVSTYSHQQSRFTGLLPLLHCFFEAQEPSLCQLVRTQFTPANSFASIESSTVHCCWLFHSLTLVYVRNKAGP